MDGSAGNIGDVFLVWFHWPIVDQFLFSIED
jgi:hypothetical protein